MFARLSAFVIWSLVAATAVFWTLRFGVQAPPAPAYAVPVERSAPARGDLARLFGAPPILAAANLARREAPSRYHLLGVMAPKSTAADGSADYGFALIAVDGKPAKAFGVGSSLDGGLVLQSVSLRTASLGPAQGARTVLLELPALPGPATGVLPIPGTATAVPVLPRPMPVPPVIAPTQAPLIGVAQPPAPQVQPGTLPTGLPPNPALPTADEARSQ